MHRHHGSILVYVIILSTAISILLAATLSQASTVFNQVQERYYLKLAEEAAEAGTAYASACLEKNDRQQTWGDDYYGGDGANRPNLAPSTSCQGTPSVYPSNSYVYSSTKLRSTFSVAKLDPGSLASSALISSTGIVELLRDGAVARTITVVLKKTITWDPELVGKKSISGTARTCAIVGNSVYCWGLNGWGQLGNGKMGSPPAESDSKVDSDIPVKVLTTGGLAGKTITDITTAEFHSCLVAAGEVYCWGYNGEGQIGDGTLDHKSSPVKVGGALTGKTVTAIGATGRTSCAIAEGKIYCWGLNNNGSLGINSGSYTRYPTPQPVAIGGGSSFLPSNYTATTLTSGSRSQNTCAIADGQAWCWGKNYSGQVGNGTTTRALKPTKVAQDSGILLGKTIIDIAQDGYPTDNAQPWFPDPHVCVVAEDSSNNRRAYCWGRNDNGQLGDGTRTDRTRPVAVSAGSDQPLYNKNITSIAAGLAHTCVLSEGKVYCWGKNTNGHLGRGYTNNYELRPALIYYQPDSQLYNKPVVRIDAGANRGCAVTEGRTYCWGLNDAGQIGDGSRTDRHKPTEAIFLRPRSNQFIY